MTVYVVACGMDTKVFESQEDASKYYDQYNNNIEMSGSHSGYAKLVKCEVQRPSATEDFEPSQGLVDKVDNEPWDYQKEIEKGWRASQEYFKKK